MTPLVAELQDLEVFEQFVLDEAHHLEKIEQYLNRFNLFEVLGVDTQTQQHSNFIAWLLDPKGSHGIGQFFLKQLITHFHYLSKPDKIRYSLGDFEKTEILRDYEGVDILVLNDEVKFTICIKNFLDIPLYNAEEVLQHNYKLIENRWPGDEYTNYYLYITPRHPLRFIKQEVYFQHLAYSTLRSMINQVLTHAYLDTQVAFFIQSYIDSVDKNMMEDDEHIRLAQQIYKRHHKAIEFIMQHKPNLSGIFTQVRQYFLAERHTEYKLLTPNDARVIRILPQEVYPIFVREQFASWEGSGAMFAIELFFEAERIWVQFCFGGIWGHKNKPEEKHRLQQIKTRYFDRMKTFSSLQSALVRDAKPTSSYPSIANFTLLKAEELSLDTPDMFDVFLERFKYFEQEVIRHWKHEVLLHLP
ncbi:PD-(D/E)XK nuclease family protein [Microscilla marina]|uniref:PD-(D/E)XK nuclease superfamily protein n=1 Tax=Microscilla marina ATCC 23134 TaxID=313606 RepID=A1ZNS6_MICM2|nr:PD-(D/E)XK nuclease family protein [Microscilla marina]EAY27965.1 hypothetical protein M23134_02634 [Microscilla marina ATCC 23134]